LKPAGQGKGAKTSRAGDPVLLGAHDLGRVHRIKAKPLRGRFASLDAAATAMG
jgi:hypothetical protein